jgi:hypothetical protein
MSQVVMSRRYSDVLSLHDSLPSPKFNDIGEDVGAGDGFVGDNLLPLRFNPRPRPKPRPRATTKKRMADPKMIRRSRFRLGFSIDSCSLLARPPPRGEQASLLLDSITNVHTDVCGSDLAATRIILFSKEGRLYII